MKRKKTESETSLQTDLQADKQTEGKPQSPRKKKSFFGKFFRRLFFFLFLALVVFVFYRGWIQLDIPEGKYALIYTKNGGLDEALIPPGQFVWRWEKLIPQNVSIHLLTFPVKTVETSLEGELPSGDIYGEFINQSGAFTMEAKVKYSYRLIPGKAPLTKDMNLDAPFEHLYAAYEGEVHRAILKYFQDNSSLALEKPAEAEQAIMELIIKKDDRFKVESLELKKLRLPDRELYRETKALYLKQMEEGLRIKADKKKEDMLLLSNTELQMEILREYGKVLSEYPVLLEYFELDKDKLDPRILRADIPKKE